jgi:hypothetical protein
LYFVQPLCCLAFCDLFSHCVVCLFCTLFSHCVVAEQSTKKIDNTMAEQSTKIQTTQWLNKVQKDRQHNG